MGMRTLGGGQAGEKRGRGATTNPEGRYEQDTREAVRDDVEALSDETGDPPALATDIGLEIAHSIIARNDSPDIRHRQSINPYRGCEHGCVYCYARPSHAWLGLSPGLDFETRIRAKTNAAELLRRELGRKSYRCETIVLGANTDAYQPAERQLRITREILEVLSACEHPVAIITKSSLVERDFDLLAPMANKGLARVYVSLTTLDPTLARRMEPRAAAPARRLKVIEEVARAGIPCGVMTAPVIPVLTDPELDALVEAAAGAGASDAGYVLLRLPHEVDPIFQDWLNHWYPLKAAHVKSVFGR